MIFCSENNTNFSSGLGVMVLMIPLNAVVARKMKQYQITQMRHKDKRVVLMDEILSGMKVIKLYAWEMIMKGKVEDYRKEELKALIKTAYLSSVTTFLWTSAPFLVALASFAAFVVSDSNNILDASTAFVSLTLFNLLRLPLNIMPMLIVFLVQANVSLKRVNRFMNADELDKDAVTNIGTEDPIVMKNASFSWDRNAAPVLNDINLNVKKGSLVAVVGQVGCGKSSLLSSMLGEMHKMSGSNNLHGKVAYVPQQAWMKNATVRDNILFGKSFKKALYEKVLDSCSLIPDFNVLPAADETEIGEKGINLSGGQKQRISIARSVYSNGELYLLDDPLSAVDAHVGKHIFENVIGPKGLLKNKTVVLVTHGVGYLKQMDNIIVMKDGTITEQGSYEELLAAGGEFADFLIQYLADQDEVEDTVLELENLKQDLEGALGKYKLEKRLSKASSLKSSNLSDVAKSIFRDDWRKHLSEESTNEDLKDNQKDSTKKGHKLIEEEKTETGGVKWSIYIDYSKAVGLWVTIGAIVLFVFYQGFSLMGNIWLSKWSTDPLATTDTSVRNKYLAIYGVFGFLQAFFVMFATAFIQIGTLKASSKLHQNMLKGIVHSTMAFFDTTPLGKYLTLFGSVIFFIVLLYREDSEPIFQRC